MYINGAYAKFNPVNLEMYAGIFPPNFQNCTVLYNFKKTVLCIIKGGMS